MAARLAVPYICAIVEIPAQRYVPEPRVPEGIVDCERARV
jgi:hypothetical protein